MSDPAKVLSRFDQVDLQLAVMTRDDAAKLSKSQREHRNSVISRLKTAFGKAGLKVNIGDIVREYLDAACEICSEGLTGDAHQLKCGHRFHQACFQEYLEASDQCPTCGIEIARRRDISDLPGFFNQLTDDDANFNFDPPGVELFKDDEFIQHPDQAELLNTKFTGKNIYVNFEDTIAKIGTFVVDGTASKRFEGEVALRDLLNTIAEYDKTFGLGDHRYLEGAQVEEIFGGYGVTFWFGS